MEQPEPWLRGPLEGVPAFLMPVFFSFQQVREDVARFTEGLSDKQVWQSISGDSLGFHLKHIAGSVDRLSTYLMNDQLTVKQLRVLEQEHTPDQPLPKLLADVHESLRQAEIRLRIITPGELLDERWIGRKRLPSSVLGLMVHLAEHTQRHLGQAITIAKALRRAPDV